MRSLPGDLASSQRDVNAPYSTAAPAQTSAITTPQSVRKSVKGKVLRSVSFARYGSTARGAQRCYPRAGRRGALPRRRNIAGSKDADAELCARRGPQLRTSLGSLVVFLRLLLRLRLIRRARSCPLRFPHKRHLQLGERVPDRPQLLAVDQREERSRSLDR